MGRVLCCPPTTLCPSLGLPPPTASQVHWELGSSSLPVRGLPTRCWAPPSILAKTSSSTSHRSRYSKTVLSRLPRTTFPLRCRLPSTLLRHQPRNLHAQVQLRPGQRILAWRGCGRRRCRESVRSRPRCNSWRQGSLPSVPPRLELRPPSPLRQPPCLSETCRAGGSRAPTPNLLTHVTTRMQALLRACARRWACRRGKASRAPPASSSRLWTSWSSPGSRRRW
mmetsp:Transcript_43748/g.103412  ORF Transcript_43748/g.103412 Transcript_43748/m.103412 type:complete len:224 (-) Transcript_43748:2529-3200(-)